MTSMPTTTKAQSKSKSGLCIPESTFRRLVKEMVGPDCYVSSDALKYMQHASETHLTETFSKAAQLAAHGSRTTVYPSDVAMVTTLMR